MKTRDLVVHAQGLELTYSTEAGSVEAIRGLDLDIAAGEFVAVEGPSGGGKSSLLNILGGIQMPTRGTYHLLGVDLSGMEEGDRTVFRGATCAFVYQDFHLLAHRAAIDSVSLPLMYQGVRSSERLQRAHVALASLGVGELAYQNASTLSGGQQQRVAIARALACSSALVIADEPTGNLDSKNTALVLDLFEKVRANGGTIVVATHEREVAERADRRIAIEDGRIVNDQGSPIGRRRTESPQPHAKNTDPRQTTTLRTPLEAPVLPRWYDLIADALGGLVARRRRFGAIVAAVAIAVALTVGVVGLSQTANSQVSAAFDARENRYVSVEQSLRREPGSSELVFQPPTPSAIVEAAARVAGVETTAVLTDYDIQSVFTWNAGSTAQVPVFVGSGDVTGAIQGSESASVSGERPAGPYAIVGHYAADSLSLGPTISQPTITVADSAPIPVASILISSPRMPELEGSIIIIDPQWGADLSATRNLVLVVTQQGAAQQVAQQMPFVVDPVKPHDLEVTAPVDPRDLRQQIESGLSSLLTVLTVLVALAAVVSLANMVLASVRQRAGEFGLRRAVGARPRDLATLVMTEATIIGVMGGVVGLALGLLGLLTAAIANRWLPVIDPLMVPIAILGGVGVGVSSGVAGAVRATGIDPAQALRH